MLESRLRSRGKMTAFQKNLEKLKCECGINQYSALVRLTAPFQVLKSKKNNEILKFESSSEAEQSESSAEVPFKGAKPHHSGDSDPSHGEAESSTEVDDEGFIVDDDANGVPAAQLPLAFSLSTHQDLTHQFKIVCQLFVHLAVQPLVDRRPFLEHALKGLTVRQLLRAKALPCQQRRNIFLCHYK